MLPYLDLGKSDSDNITSDSEPLLFVKSAKQAKKPREKGSQSVFAPVAGGKMHTPDPSPTSAGIEGGTGAASRGGQPIGVRSSGNLIYGSEKEERSGRGASSGLIGQTAKEFRKAVNTPMSPPESDLTDHYKSRDLHNEGEGGWGKTGGRAAYGGVMFNHKGHVLIRKPTNHFDGYHWTFPKGRPDGNEHPTETAHREVQEETGYRGHIVGHLAGGHSSGYSTSHFYLMHPAEHVPHKMDWETEKTKWVHPDEAHKMIAQSTNIPGRERDHRILSAAVNAHSELNKSILSKGGLPIGTVHQWDDGESHKKVGDNEWVPVTTPGHPEHPIDETGAHLPDAVPIEGESPVTNPYQAKFSQYGIAMGFPPADIPPNEVNFNLSGDIHSHWVIRHISPKTGKPTYAYTEEYHFRNSQQKWSRISLMTDTMMKKLGATLRKGLSEKNPEDKRQAALAAYVVMRTGIRPGDRYAPKDSKETFGLTTLKKSDITIDGDNIRMEFIGKKKVRNITEVKDKKIAIALKRLLKGKKDNDDVFDKTHRKHINRYLESSGCKHTLKDFRSRYATKLAARLLDDPEMGPPPPISKKGKLLLGNVKTKANIVAAAVARALNNTLPVAKSSYIHPNVWKAWAVSLSIQAKNIPLPKKIRRHIEFSKSSKSTFDIAMSLPIQPHVTIPEKNEEDWFPMPDWLQSKQDDEDLVRSLNDELEVGAKEEMEHTDDPKEAKKIATDHLKEDPKYYSKLEGAGLVDKSMDLFVAVSEEELTKGQDIDHKLGDAARKHFGLTHDHRETGYIMPNGDKLDFSGKHAHPDYERLPGSSQNTLKPGSRFDDLRGVRHTDHRELVGISHLFPGARGATDNMLEFQKRAKALRYSHGGGISANFRPTRQQISSALRGHRASGGGPIGVDYDHPETNNSVESTEIHSPTAEKLHAFYAKHHEEHTGHPIKSRLPRGDWKVEVRGYHPNAHYHVVHPSGASKKIGPLQGRGKNYGDAAREEANKRNQLSKGRRLEGRCVFQGLKVSIENDRGSTRTGCDPDGHKWSTTMKHPYGYIRGTEGQDGEHLDCFVGPNHSAAYAYVVRQKTPHNDRYDEDKALIGFNSRKAAKEAYLSHYDSPDFFHSMREIPMDAFIALLKHHKGKKLNLTDDQRFMRKACDLWVPLSKARNLQTEENEARLNKERPFRHSGVASPVTPDLPEVGRDWHNDHTEEEEEGVDPVEDESSFTTSYERARAIRRNMGKALFVSV